VSQPVVAPTNRLPAADELPHEIGRLAVFLGNLQVVESSDSFDPLLRDEQFTVTREWAPLSRLFPTPSGQISFLPKPSALAEPTAQRQGKR
jgi:hypothetical protein